MKLYGFIIYDNNGRIICHKFLKKESFFESNDVNQIILNLPNVIEENEIIEENSVLYIFEYNFGFIYYKIYAMKDTNDSLILIITDKNYKDNVICKIISEFDNYDCASLITIFSIYSNIKSGFGYKTCDYKIIRKNRISVKINCCI